MSSEGLYLVYGQTDDSSYDHHDAIINIKINCNSCFYSYQNRTYYYCNKPKGHDGKHEHLERIEWEDKDTYIPEWVME